MSALEQIMPEVERAAKRAGREWAAVTTADDVEQEIMLRLLEADYAERLAKFDPPALRSTLDRIARQVASQERIDYDHFTGNYFYSTRDVREILERGALHEERAQTNTERLDLDEGIEQLRGRNPRYADLIGKRYFNDEPVEAKMALSRAVDTLTDCMNSVNLNRSRSYIDGPGTRQAISNAQARATSNHQT